MFSSKSRMLYVREILWSEWFMRNSTVVEVTRNDSFYIRAMLCYELQHEICSFVL